MGGNVVSGLFVIGCWAQGAWRALGGSGVVYRGLAEHPCATSGPIRGEIPPKPTPALHPRDRVCRILPQRLRAGNLR